MAWSRKIATCYTYTYTYIHAILVGDHFSPKEENSTLKLDQIHRHHQLRTSSSSHPSNGLWNPGSTHDFLIMDHINNLISFNFVFEPLARARARALTPSRGVNLSLMLNNYVHSFSHILSIPPIYTLLNWYIVVSCIINRYILYMYRWKDFRWPGGRRRTKIMIMIMSSSIP